MPCLDRRASTLRRTAGRKPRSRRCAVQPQHRRLASEPLEERRLLTITVDTLVDELDGSIIDGDVSLRDAIALAPVGETIDFSITGTLLLTLGELLIEQDLTISGPGADMLTIDASGNDPTPGSTLLDGDSFNDRDGSRVLNVDDGDSDNMLTVELSGVALTGGDIGQDGGAIINRESLALSFVEIRDNDASSGGGGVYNDGRLEIVSSTIAYNMTSGRGGAIESDTDLLGTRGTFVTNSTISRNYAGQGGDGLMNFRGLLSVAHTTVAENGPPRNFGDGMGILSTFVNITQTEVYSSIIAGHALGDVQLFLPTSDSFVSLGYNVIGDGNGIAAFANNDLTGVSDPGLGTLTYNGGLTQTHGLLAGSPAIDAGDPLVANPPAFDQRGASFPRLVDGDYDLTTVIDAGAFEFGYPKLAPGAVLIVDTLDDENDGDFSAGDLSLREAVAWTNAVADTQTIEFAPALSGGTITLTLAELLIVDAVVVDAFDLAAGLTIDASGNDPTPGVNDGDGSRVFNLDDGDDRQAVDVELRGLMLTGGDVVGSGGAILSLEQLALVESVVTGNSAGVAGGGLYVGSLAGHGTITDSLISDNVGQIGGGGLGVYVVQSDFTILGTTITGNRAGDGAGVLGAVTNGTFNVVDSVLSGNASGVRAGGAWIGAAVGGTINFSRNLVVENVAGFAGGGGVYAHAIDGDVRITDSVFSGNATDGNGGGFFARIDSGTVGASRNTVTDNTADADQAFGGSGGGVYIDASDEIALDHSIIAGNHRGDGSDDDVAGMLNAASAYNLIGVDTGLAGITDGSNGNQIGTAATPLDPLLGPLADNGGPTLPGGTVLMTHALLPGSPAIDAGDPAAMAGVGDVPDFDQRGAPFGRVVGASIDIGAFEVAAPGGLPGDGNLDGKVDGLDYILWASNFGDDPADVPPGSPGNGDYNDDGAVNGLDYIVWASNFGASDEPLPGDGNLDNVVNGLDYLVWAAHFGDDPALDPPGAPENGDYNGDGVVNGLDYIVWASNFDGGASAGLAVERAAYDVVWESTERGDTLLDFTSSGSLTYSGDDTASVTAALDAVFDRLGKKRRGR